jgi:hypothetical protein
MRLLRLARTRCVVCAGRLVTPNVQRSSGYERSDEPPSWSHSVPSSTCELESRSLAICKWPALPAGNPRNVVCPIVAIGDQQ